MKKKTTEQFIEEAKLIHGEKYDYSLTNYTNNKTKIKIICPTHGGFEQLPNHHLKGCGCPACKRNKKLSTEQFIEKAKKLHNNKYDYSLTNYINAKTKVKIVCPIHGMFEQKPYNHLNGNGCPVCNSSRGENIIRNYLKEKNILFEEQKKFKECKNERTLLFDFYLPNENLLIEYNGIQHYEPIEYFGGEKQFKKQQENDLIKKQFAEKNNIKLLTISYKDYKIAESLLEENL